MAVAWVMLAIWGAMVIAGIAAAYADAKADAPELLGEQHREDTTHDR